MPLYGDGVNVRDWIYVLDNCRALDTVLRQGAIGQVYNVGAGNEVDNRLITHAILRLLGAGEDMVQYVADRLGHDRRYSVTTARSGLSAGVRSMISGPRLRRRCLGTARTSPGGVG